MNDTAMNEPTDPPRAIAEINDYPGKILIIEDQSEVRQAIAMLLATARYQTVVAQSPEEALALVQHESFDLILLDLNYRRDTTSGAEGLQLMSRLRERGIDVPIIAMTAWGSIELAVAAMHGGAHDFLQKPWDNSHLLRLVSQHLAQEKDRRSIRVRRQMELDDAIAVHRRLLPRQMPELPGFTIAANSRSFDHLGGDYYDVLSMGDKVAICIGDVIGKGLPAALVMSNLQAAVKVTAAPWVRPAELCQRINELAFSNGASDKFISFFYSVLNLRTNRLTYCNCGHNPPILLRADQSVERLDEGGTLIGIRKDELFQESSIPLEPGDRLLLFTDGLSEVEDREGRQYGEDQLLGHFQTARGSSAEDLLSSILESVNGHCDSKFTDDSTALVLCRL
ncbi:MAG: fused response regulator/phosphatase [Terriglobia bacterium]|nr:fused response regulator/phosphatase [Terriglobia bacterium]